MPIVYLLTNEVSKKQFVGLSDSSDRDSIINKACHYNKQIKADIANISTDKFSTQVLFESDDKNELVKVKRREMDALDDSYHSNKTNQRSVTISDDTVDMLNYYMENKGCSFSKAVDDLVGIGGLFFLSNQYNA